MIEAQGPGVEGVREVAGGTARGLGHGDFATDQRIMSCQGLVRSLAWKIQCKLPPYVELDDLIGFGQVGLVEAAREFDPSQGNKFITYAYHRIRGAILDGLSKMQWFDYRDFLGSRYEWGAGEVLRLEGDVAGEAGPRTLSDDARWLRGAATKLAVVRLVTAGDEEDQPGVGDSADRRTPSPEAQVLLKELKEKLRELIEHLASDARILIRGLYFEGLTLQETATRLGISKAWASRLHARTLERLARSLHRLGVEES